MDIDLRLEISPEASQLKNDVNDFQKSSLQGKSSQLLLTNNGEKDLVLEDVEDRLPAEVVHESASACHDDDDRETDDYSRDTEAQDEVLLHLGSLDLV